MPLVSILIPAYNVEDWLADSLRSALEQSWPHLEIIVVDDGSTDRTLEIARGFESRGVRVYMQANQGAAAARNAAYGYSTGAYIQWLDADDILDRDKIALQMRLVQDGAGLKTLLSGAWGNFMFHARRAKFEPTGLWQDLSPVDWLVVKMSQNVYMQTANWLVSRELSEAAGPWNTRLLGDDDGEYFCRVLLASDGVRFVAESRVYYRSFGIGGLNYIGNSARKIEAHWISMKLHIQYLRSLEKSARVDQTCLTYLRTWLFSFYPEWTSILEEAEKMAVEFGEPLGTPQLSWKYVWAQRAFGWHVAKPVQRNLRRWRWIAQKNFYQLLFKLNPSDDWQQNKHLV
jgi:glycosyltransferase involved in cell wall biosynthesis